MVDEAMEEVVGLEEAEEELARISRLEMLRKRKDCKHNRFYRARLEHFNADNARKGTKYTELVSCARCGLEVSRRTYTCKHKAGFKVKMSKHKVPIKVYICKLCGFITAGDPNEKRS